VLGLLESGSDGRAYLLKERVHDRRQLVAAIEAVASGQTVIDATIVDVLVAAKSRSERSLLFELTVRELEVLSAIAEGKSNAAISEELAMTKHAVEKHINAIFLSFDPGDAWRGRRGGSAMTALSTASSRCRRPHRLWSPRADVSAAISASRSSAPTTSSRSAATKTSASTNKRPCPSSSAHTSHSSARTASAAHSGQRRSDRRRRSRRHARRAVRKQAIPAANNIAAAAASGRDAAIATTSSMATIVIPRRPGGIIRCR
jgi:hypothetical protein